MREKNAVPKGINPRRLTKFFEDIIKSLANLRYQACVSKKRKLQENNNEKRTKNVTYCNGYEN